MHRGDQFEELLVTFLVDYLENDNSGRIFGLKKLIINNDDTCYSFISQEHRMAKSEEVPYYAKHEEVDTRMIYYVGQLPCETNVTVRTVDTDVVVIALRCFHQLHDKRIWVEPGIHSKNNLRYISMNQLFDQLGEPLCKIKSFKLLEQNPELQEAF